MVVAHKSAGGRQWRQGVLLVAVLMAASLGSWCAVRDPNRTAPLVLRNTLTDSVRAVIRVADFTHEVPDTTVVTEALLAPGETKRMGLNLSLWQLVDSGVPSNQLYILSVSTFQGVLWQSPVLATWWRETGVVVPIRLVPPPAGKDRSPQR